MIDGCWIDTYYVKRDKPYSRYKDTFHLHPYNEFTQKGPNTWKGSYGPYVITVVQQHRQHDIKEDDVVFSTNPGFKEDPNIMNDIPSKKTIAQVLNNYLDKIYG